MGCKETIENNKVMRIKEFTDSKDTIDIKVVDDRTVGKDRSTEPENTQNKYLQYMGELHPVSKFISVEGLSDSEAVQAVIKFYEKSSKKITNERTGIYQKRLKVNPRSITIEKNSRRWGSCNTKKEITYHYLIAALPLELIDYIVIHELCHLHHMNHDRSFWRKVGSILPDYKLKVKMLEGVVRRDQVN